MVVHGTAKVTIGGEEKLVSEDQSVYIAATQWHRLENPGKTALELIEVQLGSYLGEDDIVRADEDAQVFPGRDAVLVIAEELEAPYLLNAWSRRRQARCPCSAGGVALAASGEAAASCAAGLNASAAGSGHNSPG